LFNTLYQEHPQLLKGDPENAYQKALKAVLANSNFDKLRIQTKGSLQWASVGATLLLDELVKAQDYQDEYPEEQQQKQPKAEKPEESEEKSEDEGDEDNNGDSEEGESDSSDSESDSNSNSREEESGSNNADDGTESDDFESGSDNPGDASDDEDSDDIEKDLEFEDIEESESNQNLDAAIEKAAEKLSDLIAGTQAGRGDKLPTFDDAANQSEIMTQLAANANIMRILKMIGRFRLSANFLPAFTIGYPQETIGITVGRDLARTLPQDLGLLLGNKQEFGIFMDKYNKGALLNYKNKSVGQAGKGPMIVCIDDSGSMSHGTYNTANSEYITRRDWAKALAIALYLQCVKEKRAFAAVVFSDNATLFEPKIKDKVDTEFINQVVRVFYGGGTSFNVAWDRSIRFFANQSKTSKWRTADIAFITDGEGHMDQDRWIADKKKYDIRLVSFMLGAEEKESMSMWTEEEIVAKRYHHLYTTGTPKHPNIKQLADLSEAIMFISELSDAENKAAFNLVTKKKAALTKTK
jgi:uncharacterized protein with von Willebrand factor type A (vWA) domain